jgi:trk system potassium uptake protein TrkA
VYVIIAGAGRVGSDLAKKLVENKHDVVVIERDKAACDLLYSETGAVVINGNIAEVGDLLEAGVRKAEVLVATASSDADNLACAILSKSFGVPRIIARMRNPAFESAYRLAGVTSILRVADILISQMMVEIEQSRVRKLVSLGGGKADIYTVVVPEAGKVVGKTLAEVTGGAKFPRKCMVVALYDHETEEFALPRPEQVIAGNQELVIISPAEFMKKAADFLTR